MLFYLIIAVWLGLTVFICIKEWEDFENVVLAFFGGGLATVSLTFIIAMAFSSFCEVKTLVRHNVCPIASLRGATELHGSFVLGCGNIGTDEKYYFMYDLGNHAFKRGTVETEGVVLIETAAEPPSLSYDTMMTTNNRCYRWWPEWFVAERWSRENLTLSVPPGTVIQKFEVR